MLMEKRSSRSRRYGSPGAREPGARSEPLMSGVQGQPWVRAETSLGTGEPIGVEVNRPPKGALRSLAVSRADARLRPQCTHRPPPALPVTFTP